MFLTSKIEICLGVFVEKRGVLNKIGLLESGFVVLNREFIQ